MGGLRWYGRRCRSRCEAGESEDEGLLHTAPVFVMKSGPLRAVDESLCCAVVWLGSVVVSGNIYLRKKQEPTCSIVFRIDREDLKAAVLCVS